MAYDPYSPDSMAGFAGYDAMAGGGGIPSDPYASMQQPQMPQMPQSFMPEMPQQQPQSLFSRLFSGVALGLAAGAGAPDVGSAFASGYAAVMQQKEKERQMILEERQRRMQEKLFESQMADQFINRVKLMQEMEFVPKELQLKSQQIQGQIMAALAAGKNVITGTYKNKEEYAQVMKAKGEPMWLDRHFVGADGSITTFKADPSVEANIPIPLKLGDGTETVFANAGQALEFHDSTLRADIEREKMRSQEEQQRIAGRYGVQAAQVRQSSMQAGNLTEVQQKQIQGIDFKINDLDGGIRFAQSQVQKAQDALQWLNPDEPGYKEAQQRVSDFQTEINTKSALMKQLEAQRERMLSGGESTDIPRFAPGTVLKNGSVIENYDEGGNIVLKLPNGRRALAEPSGKLIRWLTEDDILSNPSQYLQPSH